MKVWNKISPLIVRPTFFLEIPDNSDRPLKPPRQLPQFRIKIFDKMHLFNPEQSRNNDHHAKSVNTSDEFVQNTSNSEFGNPYKVKDLVSKFQSDR